MYVAMNRFRIANNHKKDFIEIWRNRNSFLKEVSGFKKFKLLQGESTEEETVFISHSAWETVEHFKAWTQSEHFKKAHAGAKAPKGTYLSHPKFEGYEVVLKE